jgi:hypothetical protein
MPEPLPWWRILAPLVVFALLALAAVLRPLPLLRVILLSSVAMISYATLQDQVSARLCPEYFTIGHPPIRGLSDPMLLGLAWGFLAGFPGGLALGIPLSLVATLGSLPQLPPRSLVRPILVFVAGVALATLIAGASGAYNAAVVNIAIREPWAELIPAARHRQFFAVACAHFGTYLGGVVMGVGVCGWVVRQRRLLEHPSIRPSQ